MATMLVNQNCMESLRNDITDLQGTLLSVFSHTGAMRFPSWKFPDKASCDLDLVALLERYDFSEDDPEFTQCSHVVLLELVIDRLLLLLQSFTGYTENLTSEHNRSPSGTTRPCMSIGLAVKKYWTSMLKLGTLYQQLAAEKKCSREDTSSPRDSSQAIKAENERSKSSFSEDSTSDVSLPSFRLSPLSSSADPRQTNSHLAARSEAQLARGPAPSARTIHTQTTESSLGSCEACERAQASLRDVSLAIVHVCTSQNLPSSLSKFLEAAQSQKPLTPLELTHWASEQSKDLSRINKHLRNLVELVGPLNGALEEAGKQNEELEKQLEVFEGRLRKEKATQEQRRKEAERLSGEKEEKSLKLVASLKKEKQELQKRVHSLEENTSSLKEKLHSQEATIQELEQAQKDLLREMKTKMVDKGKVQQLEDQVQVQASQLESAKLHMNQATTELAKERAKAESIHRHRESVQAKQRVLIQHMDNLDQECKQLKTSLAEGEEEQETMKERLEEMREEMRQAQQQLEAQQKLTEKVRQEKLSAERSTSELQKTVSDLGRLVQEMKEKEKLLVLFPDLHISVETQFESTGDVMEDMAKQLQANNIRISILEEENSRLRAALSKTKEVAQSDGPKIVPPTQLWIRSPEKAACDDGRRPSLTGYPVETGFRGGAARISPDQVSLGVTSQNVPRSAHAIERGGSASQRTKLTKPPSGRTSRQATVGFACENSDIGAFGRDRVPGHSAHGTPHRPEEKLLKDLGRGW